MIFPFRLCEFGRNGKEMGWGADMASGKTASSDIGI